LNSNVFSPVDCQSIIIFLKYLPTINFAGGPSIFTRTLEIASKVERNNRVVD
jgi:hypothetical protein